MSERAGRRRKRRSTASRSGRTAASACSPSAGVFFLVDSYPSSGLRAGDSDLEDGPRREPEIDGFELLLRGGGGSRNFSKFLGDLSNAERDIPRCRTTSLAPFIDAMIMSQVLQAHYKRTCNELTSTEPGKTSNAGADGLFVAADGDASRFVSPGLFCCSSCPLVP